MTLEGPQRDQAQHSRARQYAICTYALVLDHVTDGAEGVFDQALTSGLVAIVAHSWPGEEKDRNGRTLPASALLKVISRNGKAAGDGIVRVLHDPSGPEFDEPLFDDEPWPNFTEVAVDVLQDGIGATQAIRHARDHGQLAHSVISEDHLKALEALDAHPALGRLYHEQGDRWEQRISRADAVETARAEAYLEAIGEEEVQRRAALDYVHLYAEKDRKGMTLADVEECPVCWHMSLVVTGWESNLGEIGIGHCIICSYHRDPAVAESEAIDLQIQRAVEGDD